jgi:uncharacterized protein (TIGR00369 family)
MTAATTPSRQRTFTWVSPAEARERKAGLNGREWLEAMKRGDVPVPPAAALIGMQVERVTDDEVVFSLEPQEFHYNPAGTVHGGVITTLADTAMTTAIIARLPAGKWAPTLEVKVNFIRPITEATGRVFCAGRVIHVGSTTAVAESRVVDADGKLYAHATTTSAIAAGWE